MEKSTSWKLFIQRNWDKISRISSV